MLTKEWFPLFYHKEQSALWRCPARFAAVVAGRGSGKTLIARRRVVRFLNVRKPWYDPIYFYALPTIAQAKKVAWTKIKSLIPNDWLVKNGINETEMKITTKFGSTLYVIGMDKPQRAEGIQYDGGVIDESSDQKPGVFDTSFLPALSERKGWCWRIGVPKRFGVGAPNFKSFFDKGLKNEKLFEGASEELRIQSFTWKSEDVADKELVEFARRNLDEKDYSEQFGATWELVGGRIFHAFDEILNVDDEISYHPNLPLCIGSDFNVDPMAWVLFHRYPNKIEVFDEIWLRNTSTQATLDHLFNKYGKHNAGFEFYGDATGRARKTAASSAAQSDYLILRADTRFKGAKIYYPSSNPAVVDRFASTNAMFKNVIGERRCKVHPRCKQILRDVIQRAYIQGTREPNDKGDIGHITDALGYPIHRLFPIKYLQDDRPQVGIEKR